MALEVTPATIFDFTKRLIELGNIYEVLEDLTIKNTVSDSLVAIPSGKKSIPLKVFKDGMESGDFAILMPYKEQLGVNREREWFFDSLQIIIGNLLKELTLKIIKDAVDKKDDNYQQYALMNKISGLADANMLKEVDKLRPHDFIFVNYNKRQKTACAQSRIMDPELEDEHPKFRKKSWEVIRTLFGEFIGTTDPEDMYTYQSTILSIPETDAKLHVIIALVKSMAAYVKDILDIEVDADILEQHLANLEGYGKLHAWVAVTSPSANEEITSRPWDTTPSFGTTQHIAASAVGGFNMPSVMPASSVSNIAPIGYGGFQPQQQQFGQYSMGGGPVPVSSIPSSWNNGPFGNSGSGGGNPFGNNGTPFRF